MDILQKTVRFEEPGNFLKIQLSPSVPPTNTGFYT